MNAVNSSETQCAVTTRAVNTQRRPATRDPPLCGPATPRPAVWSSNPPPRCVVQRPPAPLCGPATPHPAVWSSDPPPRCVVQRPTALLCGPPTPRPVVWSSDPPPRCVVQ
ncbi:hypothetical protein JYU34_017106 [Plutella xylostella]|uniref:Uncharacterized protein n=1 Tax=Plutella xylostella TaxID=51655 RepID=A0ABQ7Q1T6_PLUXY|nr:hypothetical protein JYU34_017106 [Plutella xylostella]